MHLLPEIILTKQTYNATPQNKHPSLETFSLTNLPPNSELANGSVTWVKLGKQCRYIYKNSVAAF